MADTNTPSLNLVLPEVGASSDTWGTKINSDLTAIDNLFSTGPYLKVANGGTGAGTAATAATNLGLGTGDSPQFTAVNIGHASDTTISRSSAGIIAVEGVTVPLNSITNVHTAQQVEIGHASDTTLTRVSAGVAAIEGKNIALNGTGETLTTGSIELGTASDTTITRSAAGVIAVEGGVVPKENRANTFSADQTINAKLDVNGPSGVTSFTGTTRLGVMVRGSTATTDYSGIDFTGASGSNPYARIAMLASASGSVLQLGTSNNYGSGVTNSAVNIDPSGNVGIGATPTASQGRLQVANTGITGGSPAASGTTDANQLAVFQAGSVQLRFGVTSPGDYWLQPSLSSDYATNTNLLLCPNGGNVTVNGSGGLGYGTGSGGSVTQVTSKSTGVTLNKTNGKIVTHNASLANATTVTFVVTNSTVAATDTVIVHRSSGGTDGDYVIGCDAVAAGSFRVYIRNQSGGSLAAALTINFAVIKAVTT